MALVSGVFYSAGKLDEPWSTLKLNPIYCLVDAARYGFTAVGESLVAIDAVRCARLSGPL